MNWFKSLFSKKKYRLEIEYSRTAMAFYWSLWEIRSGSRVSFEDDGSEDRKINSGNGIVGESIPIPNPKIVEIKWREELGT